MRINVAKSAGFCFGVKRAIELALKAASNERDVRMLGDIVHNEEVVKQINKAGIKRIKTLSEGKGKTLLIRAHGAASNIYKKAEKLGYKIIDATCPMVKEIHNIGKDLEKKGYKIIIIGDKKHAEVIGIKGHLKNTPLVIDKITGIPLEKIKKIKKACILAQSTQNIEKVTEIVKLIQEQVKNTCFFNTICGPTRQKQTEIKRLPKENDLVIIIGSKTSANTKRLYNISKSFNRNTYWVQSDKDLKAAWFKHARSVGVTAGASTPGYTTDRVIKKIKKIAKSYSR